MSTIESVFDWRDLNDSIVDKSNFHFFDSIAFEIIYIDFQHFVVQSRNAWISCKFFSNFWWDWCVHCKKFCFRRLRIRAIAKWKSFQKRRKQHRVWKYNCWIVFQKEKRFSWSKLSNKSLVHWSSNRRIWSNNLWISSNQFFFEC